MPTPLERLTAKPPDSDLSDVIRAIAALTTIWANPDTSAEQAALDAHQAGRAAFWTTGKYHNQAAIGLCESANVEGLPRALLRHADDGHPSHAARTPYLLASLVPLNRLARAEIEAAHAQLAERIAFKPIGRVYPAPRQPGAMPVYAMAAE